ncbi:MAG: hypothetical protein RBS39_13030 [Phycisphaerales bacterium]|jgi:hypothetical protein|nr:hypothetical protein [Phycisphaerales bacterium]
MKFAITENERRTRPRIRRSDVVLWRPGRFDPFASAWLLETSRDGFAFAWRGVRLPKVGAIIDAIFDPSEAGGRPRLARVCRVQHVHEDLVVIAGELLGEFPQARSEAAAATREIKPSGSGKRAFEAFDDASGVLASQQVAG